jgi:hypothetical protein
VRGLDINGFAGPGILLGSQNDTVQGNYLGTDITGTVGAPNGVGIQTYFASGLIGGSTAAERNLISGNSGYGIVSDGGSMTIAGNYIGTDVTGEHALSQSQTGVYLVGGASIVGGDDPGAGNLISGNGGGVRLGSAGANVVEGNLIGTDATGTAAIPNVTGVYLADGAAGSTIGGTTAGARNIISGNSSGIYFNFVSDNVIEGNFIGTDITGAAPLGNAGNVLIEGGNNDTVGGTAPGAGNIIAYGTAWFEGGVNIFSPSAPFPSGVSVRGNAIFGNAGIGIDLSFGGGGGDGLTPNEQGTMPGPNNLQNFPVLSAATALAGGTLVTGTLNSTPNTTFAVDVYANDAVDPTAHGQGKYFLGAISVTTDASGNACFSATVPGVTTLGQYLSATATDPGGNTSEFSFDVPVYSPGEVPATGSFYVLNTNDSGYGSLRQAILDANATPGTNTIAFDIARGDVRTIQPLSPLPTISDSVVIDGWTQPGFAGSPLIVLDGSKTSGNGLAITAGGSTVRGLVIDSFQSYGIALQNAGGNIIEANYIGVDSTGTIAKGNGDSGVYVSSGDNTIGGTTAADRNIISGNGYDGVLMIGAAATRNVIEGNYIGTDVSGTKAVPNAWNGVQVQTGSGNLVGGTTPAARNIISGNLKNGVQFQADSHDVSEGNYIGTDVTGGIAIGNQSQGVLISDAATDDTVSGSLISGNAQSGVVIGFDTFDTRNIVSGNMIGTNAAGTAPLMNGGNGVWVLGTGNTVGGLAPTTRNVISANPWAAVSLSGNGNIVEGNYLGTDVTGTVAIGNGGGVSVSGANNTVGGGTAGARNVISGNLGAGIGVSGVTASGNVIEGNYVGVDVTGAKALANGWLGIIVNGGATNNLIGSNGDGVNDAGERNIISANGTGISISGAGSDHNVVAGNYLGTDASGENSLGNIWGAIVIDGGAQGNLIGTDGQSLDDAGQRNLISGNSTGVEIASNGNTVAGNYIGTDATGTKALPNGTGILITGGGQRNLVGTNGDGLGDADERNVVSGNSGNGIWISGSFLSGQTIANTVAGNFIGTDASGTRAIGNHAGVDIDGGSQGNLVGTNGNGVNTAAARNIISGNVEGISILGSNTNSNIVAGNYIGTDVTGESAVGNSFAGIQIVNGPRQNLIGTNGDGVNDQDERNVIADSYNGVYISGAGSNANVVAGNYIGTDAAGTKALGNGDVGVFLSSGPQLNLIGTNGHSADDAGERNIISGNNWGVLIRGANTNTVAGNYIGTDVTGEHALGNGIHGVTLDTGAQYNRVGIAADGTGDADQRNVISGNVQVGVMMSLAGTSYNAVAGNFIGTDASGEKALGNAWGVVAFSGASANLIGSDPSNPQPLFANVISGNSQEGVAFSVSADRNTLAGNLIGTDAAGKLPLGNTLGGVAFTGASSGNVIGGPTAGAGNTIAFNGAAGIFALDTSQQNSMRGNSIFANAALGIDLANDGVTQNRQGSGPGPNDWQNYPVFASAYEVPGGVQVSGTLNSTPNANFAVDFYGNDAADPSGHGQGHYYLGSINVTTNASGNVSFSTVLTGLKLGQSLSATATDPNGNTSEFSLDAPVDIATATSLSTDHPSGSVYGQTVTLTVSVAPENVAGSPTGAVQFVVDGADYAAPVTLTGGAATLLISTLHAGPHTFAAVYASNNIDYAGSVTSAALSEAVTPAPLTITADNKSMVYGGPLPALTANETGFVNGDTATSLTTQPALSTTATVASHVSGSPYSITDSGAVDADYNISYVAGNLMVTPAALTVTASDATRLFLAANPVFTDTITGFVNGDTASIVSGAASLTTTATTASPAGTYPIAAAQGSLSAADYNFAFVNGTLTVTVADSIYVLNANASGALTLSGNAGINTPGLLMVDSNSATAITASGNASAEAANIEVVGGYQASGNATLSPAPTTGIAAFGDPLAALAAPSTTGLTSYGAESLSGNATATIQPGIYSRIAVSGNASLTMAPGTYIIEGGGLTVTGNASIAGIGVTIVNAGSNYPSAGGNYGGITLAGNGKFNLAAPTNGPDAGIAIYQSRDNTRALSLSGNASSGLTGTVYAANALVTLSGNAQLQGSFVVGSLNLSGNVSQTQLAGGSGGSGDVAGIANTLLAGNLNVYVNNADGGFNQDELARIADAIDGWNALLVPYSVSIAEVSDPALANLVVDTATISASGTAAQGVLGCYNSAASEVKLLAGWNWYAGADPSQMAAGQYDFQTTITHELGHALGLGHSPDPNSPMYESLAADMAHRSVVDADLNIPDAPAGADPEMAAGFAEIASDTRAPAAAAEYDVSAADSAQPQSGSDLARDAVFAAVANQAASGVMADSQENNTQLINDDYFHYLGRAADADGLAYWLKQFADGQTNEDVIAGFTGSAEYYDQHTSG